MSKTLSWFALLALVGTAVHGQGRDLIPNPSFEDAADPRPAGWRIRDRISGLSRDRARSGEWSVKIVDPDHKVGADIVSARRQVRPDKRYVIWVWAYLEEGAPGLGVYPRFWDADGRELNEAREKQIARAHMAKGKWTSTVHPVVTPPEAREIAVWLHTFSTSVLTAYVDDVRLLEYDAGVLDDVLLWRGGVPDPDGGREGGFAVRWAHADNSRIAMPFSPPADWSEHSGLSFWLHSAAAVGSSFMLIVSSENEATEGIDYYPFKITLDWTGWRRFLLPFRELGVTREPRGWHSIDSVSFTASGWGNTPHPEAVVRLDDFGLAQVSESGPRLSDEGLFAALDLERPELGAVKAAAARKDWAAAKRELARHLRERTAPRWSIDWRDRPSRGVTPPPPEADRAPDQWDYFSHYVTVDWEGWKRFSLKKTDFSPKAFVEGKGWRGKQPIGWHWIKYLAFRATGWGLTPSPRTVLFFDDLQLRTADGARVLADFEGEVHPFKGLQRTDERAKNGRFAGKWDDFAGAAGVTCRGLPHDWTDVEAFEFWLYSEKATKDRFIMVLDSDAVKASKRVEDYIRRRFSRKQGQGDWAVEFKDRIDWAANPTEGPDRTHLWNEALNRHFHFRDLSRAYWEGGDERAVRAMVEQWLDWIERNPRPVLSSGNRAPGGSYAWQTLTTGIRLESVWPNALYRCLDSPQFTDEALATILKSVADQAGHLVQWPTGGNWLTEESMGLFTAGMLFPEFREAAQWRRTAVERLYRQLDDEVYPDGMEYELASGYNNWVVSNFCNVVERARMNELTHELPADFMAKIEKMFDYQLYAMRPDSRLPALNDSGAADVRKSLARGVGMFPGREDFLFGATLGQQGKTPSRLSCAFPYSGHYVMRSGWDSDAAYLMFDSGPFGYGHQHEDKLHFVLWAYGRLHVLDPGNYSYDRSKWRRYVLGTHGHNTVMVDGQGQKRRGHRETYVWPKPWDKPVPPGNDTFWRPGDVADFARGSYRFGYGPQNGIKVVHTRRLLFVKPQYFVVQDTLLPEDDAEHLYDFLFHLNAETATLDQGALSVRTGNPAQSGLALIPANTPGLQARIAKGEEDPVQGWANQPWRPVPTAVYSRKGKGPVRLACVLAPIPASGACPVAAVEHVPLTGGTAAGCALDVRLADGRRDRFIFNEAPGAALGAGVLQTDAELLWVRTDAEGKELLRHSAAPPK